VIALGGLVWLSVLLNPKRWEETIGEGRLAGRERIYPAATQMFLERPLFGWGTVQNLYVLGPRVGLVKRDTHNLALFVLTETGLAGGIPYFIGVGLAAAAAWRARRGPLGIAPVALMACLLVVNMSITWHVRKIHWLVLGLALASPAVVEPLPRRTAFPRPRPVRA
jgi:O-antigen ligase